jgi:HEAT repeat protein
MTVCRFAMLPILLGMCSLVASAPRAAEADARLAYDEQVLKAAKTPVDGPALLEFFRSRTIDAERLRRIPALIQQLGHHQFLVREAAAHELIQLGKLAAPALEKGTQHPDPEIGVRSERCLTAIADRSETSLVVAAVRVLAVRNPPGTIEVLLSYLPSVGDEVIEDEVLTALGVVGVCGGQPAAVLVEAARSERIPHRLAAASALVRVTGADHRKAVRQLLADPEPRVRWRAAQLLLTVQDKSAIPALIALVGEAPPEIARRADQVLGIMAGAERPSIRPEASALAPRRQCLDGWTAWWRKHESTIDLKKLEVLTTEDPDFTQLVQRSLKIIQESLAGNSADQKLQNRAWTQAMMIAAFAQTGPGGAATPRRATLRDSALQLATTIRARKFDEAREQLKAFPYLQPQRPAPLGNVRMLDRYISLEEIMHQFASLRSGGLEIEKQLLKLEQEVQKTKAVPAGMFTEDLALTALHIAKVAEILKEHAPAKKPLEWQQKTEDLRGAAIALSVAARSRNEPEAIKAIKRLNAACYSCHEVFRD